jgi:diacylglycerol kinase (ATP)
MRSERISILFNPSAGMGRARKMQGALEEQLRRHGIPYDLAITESEENLRELTRIHAAKYGIVVGAGGDSTFHIIVNEIMRAGADASFGMVPVGSSNDIAKAFGVGSLEKACLALKGRKIKKIDIGCIYDREKPVRCFLGQANIGLGVFVNQYVAGLAQRRSRLAKRQTAAGILGIIRAYRNKRIPLPLIVESEVGRMDGEFVASVISNVRYWASGKLINPNASPDDGRLDLCLIRKCSLARLARISSLANRGKHAQAKEVKILQAPSFEISSLTPFEIQTDGEILKSLDHPTPYKKITFKIFPQSLNIIL